MIYNTFISQREKHIFKKFKQKDIDISFPDLNGTTIDVEKSDEPIFVVKII